MNEILLFCTSSEKREPQHQRGGNSRSTPPKGANLRRIISAKLPFGGGGALRAERKISRASCSIERPCWAARTLSRVLVLSSSCRIVNVAMLSILALLNT